MKKQLIIFVSLLLNVILAECSDLGYVECLNWPDFCEWNENAEQCQDIGGGSGGTGGVGQGYSNQSGPGSGNSGNSGSTRSCRGGRSTGRPGNPGTPGGTWGVNVVGGGSGGKAVQKKNAKVTYWTKKTLKGEITNI